MGSVAPGWVWLYQDANYKGKIWKFNTDCPALSIADANDKTSSIQLGPGVQIKVFTNYKGTDLAVPSSLTAMPKGFKDNLSSFKFVAGAVPSPPVGEVWLYEGDNYQGQCWLLAQGEYPSLKTFGCNDRIRSIIVGPTTSVQIWLDEKMTGQSDAFNNNRPTLLNGFSEKVSSLKVSIVAANAAPAVVPNAASQTAEECWMERNAGLIGDLLLSQVPIVGTHDSGAYKISGGQAPDAPEVFAKLPSVVHNFIEPFALAQGKDIENQLKDGVRFFDLRMSWHDDKKQVYTCHSFFCASFNEILDDVRRFSLLHPKEIIMLRLSHWYFTPAKQDTFPVDAALQQILTGLGTAIMSSKIIPNPFATPLNNLWAAQTGKVIVMWEPDRKAKMPSNEFTYNWQNLQPSYQQVEMWPGPFAPLPLRRLSFMSMEALRRQMTSVRGPTVTYALRRTEQSVYHIDVRCAACKIDVPDANVARYMQADGERYLRFVMVPGAKPEPEDEADSMGRTMSLRAMNEPLSKAIPSWISDAAALGLSPNVVTCDYHDDAKVASAVLRDLPRFVQNVRANAPQPFVNISDGTWAFMSFRGRFLEFKDNKAAPTAEKFAASDHFVVQKSPASPAPSAFSLRPAATASGLLRWNDTNLELAQGLTVATASETFEFQQAWEEAAPVWHIKAGANYIGVNGEKIIYGNGDGKAYNWIAFRLTHP